MKRLALFGVLVCLCNVNLAGQSKSSFAGVSYTLGELCTSGNQDPTAVCPSTSWIITDTNGSILYNGGGSAEAHDDYGLLQAADSALVTCPPNSAAGAAATGAGSQASFEDSLTFPGLSGSGPYYITVSLRVLGFVSGGFLAGVSSAELGAEADLVDATTSNSADCSIQDSSTNQGVVRQTCSTKMQIFPADVVSLRGVFNVGANAVCPNNSSTSSVSQTVEPDFISSKSYGATYILNLQYANGKKVSGAKGVIIAASGTQYPTH